MSLGSYTFRSAAFAAVAGASLFAGVAQAESSFTSDQCKMIALTGIEVAKKAGPSNLSPEFKKSFRNFLGAKLTCDGPKDILTPTLDDVAAYNTIEDILMSKAGGGTIDLFKAGVRSVDPKDVASRELRHSELPAPRPGG